VIVVTLAADPLLVRDALAAGAVGFFLRNVPPERLVQAIVEVAAGGAALGADPTHAALNALRARFSPPGRLACLSIQQFRILALIARGLSNRVIGQMLNLSENTVRNYSVSIFAKLHVTNRTSAAAVYHEEHPAEVPELPLIYQPRNTPRLECSHDVAHPYR
jgi:two-component system, NarL family, response regulator DevR